MWNEYRVIYLHLSLTTMPSVIKSTIPPRIWIIKKDTGSPCRLSFRQQLKILPWPVTEQKKKIRNDVSVCTKWHSLFCFRISWQRICYSWRNVRWIKMKAKKYIFLSHAYLQLHVPSAPSLGPRPPAGSPLLVHPCLKDVECCQGSMGVSSPDTWETAQQWAQAAEKTTK